MGSFYPFFNQVSILFAALSSVATDVEGCLLDMNDMLQEEEKQESEFAVRHIYLSIYHSIKPSSLC